MSVDLTNSMESPLDSYVTGSGVSFGENGGWSCSCKVGWTGPDCSHPLESNCGDDIDNDNGEHTFISCSSLRVCFTSSIFFLNFNFVVVLCV